MWVKVPPAAPSNSKNLTKNLEANLILYRRELPARGPISEICIPNSPHAFAYVKNLATGVWFVRKNGPDLGPSRFCTGEENDLLELILDAVGEEGIRTSLIRRF